MLFGKNMTVIKMIDFVHIKAYYIVLGIQITICSSRTNKIHFQSCEYIYGLYTCVMGMLVSIMYHHHILYKDVQILSYNVTESTSC